MSCQKNGVANGNHWSEYVLLKMYIATN